MLGRQIRRLSLTKNERFDNLYSSNLKGLRFISGFDRKRFDRDESERNQYDQIQMERMKSAKYDGPDPNFPEKEPRTLKQWRPEYDTTRKLATRLKIFDRGTRPSTDFIVRMNAPWDISLKGISNWWDRKKQEIEVLDQRFVKERHEILGSNLASAHFLVHRGGKVKFHGHDNWVEKDKTDEYELPGRFDPNYLIEAIDINGINLYYEGLENLKHLNYLESLCLKGSKTIDDWSLDRISSQFPALKVLDVSNCENVSERGLEALYRMQTLRTLIVTNHHGSPAFELTCMMLEDVNPHLKCDIRSPEVQLDEESESDKIGA